MKMSENIKTGGFMFLTRIAYRNIYRSKRRSFSSVLAIAISTFIIVFMMGFVYGLMKSAVYVVKTYNTGDISINTAEFESEKDYLPVTSPVEADLKDIVEKIGGYPGVRNVFPRIASLAVLMDNNIKNTVVWGIDFKGESEANFLNLKTRTDGIIKGYFPAENENGCIVGRGLAGKMNVTVGDRITMKLRSSQYSDKYYRAEVTGIFDFDYAPMNENYIIIPFAKLQKMLTLSGKTQSLAVFLKDGADLQKTKSFVKTLFTGDDTVVKTWDENYFIVLFRQVQILYYAIFAVFVILSSFLIINTILMVIHERIKEIGMMGALGMNKREIVQVFFLEALILSVIGALFGSILGGVVTFIASFYPIDTGMFTSKGVDLPTSGTIYIDFSIIYVVAAFFFGIFIAGICTLFPSLKSAFVEPVEAIRR
jgi:putative ABC transport system permease protein